MKSAKIIVCCHKQDVVAKTEHYYPIHVGKALSSIDLGICADNTGDNISMKNRSYCELTGMYWAWKNLKDVDVIGLCHYRRYFDFHNQCISYMPYTAFSLKEFDNIDLSIPDGIIENLKEGEIYLAKPKKYSYSLYTNYCVEHISDDIRVLEKYIFEHLNDEYKKAWYHIMQCNNNLSPYNMFLMTWYDFDKYCSWLFPILSEMEKQIDISHYSPIEARIYGYMAERLLNVWVEANYMKVRHLPIIWFSDYTAQQKVPSRLRMKLRNVKADMAVRLATHNNMNKWLKNKPYNV